MQFETGIVSFVFQNDEDLITEDNNFANFVCVWHVVCYTEKKHDLQVLPETAHEHLGHK
jgi:hypothetical protein